jgi:hypothetical protein
LDTPMVRLFEISQARGVRLDHFQHSGRVVDLA